VTLVAALKLFYNKNVQPDGLYFKNIARLLCLTNSFGLQLCKVEDQHALGRGTEQVTFEQQNKALLINQMVNTLIVVIYQYELKCTSLSFFLATSAGVSPSLFFSLIHFFSNSKSAREV
jgi:hypothetical protein